MVKKPSDTTTRVCMPVQHPWIEDSVSLTCCSTNPLIPSPMMRRQEDAWEPQASQGYIVRPCLTQTNKATTTKTNDGYKVSRPSESKTVECSREKAHVKYNEQL